VALNPNASCGRCGYCREGRPLLCRALTGLGSSRPGGFAQYMTAPAAQVFSVAELDPDVAVFTEPVSCVVHGVDRLGAVPGSSALVFGAGPTGLILAQLIAATGAAHVTVADIVAFKLEVARALGKATVAEACLPLTRNGGTVLLYGVADERDRITISPYELFRRELTIIGSFAEIISFPAAIAVLRSGRVRTEGIISHRFDLDGYGTALETLRRDPTAHKVVIAP
jgi:D-arabinitol dehydrogenase (NADP+)